MNLLRYPITSALFFALALGGAACADPPNPFNFGVADTGSIADAGPGVSDADASDIEAVDGTTDSSDDVVDTSSDSASDTAPETVEPVDVVTDAAADAISGTVVRLGTFNLKRLFDTVCDSGACEPGDFEVAPAEAQVRFRASQIAQGIAQMEVDVVAIQEIENDAAMQILLDEVAAVLGDEWRHGAIGELGFDASLDTAVISRFPITEVTLHRDSIAVFRPDNSRTTFARELLQVEIAHQGRRVVLFSAHFKSKNNDDEGRRFGEAVTARVIVEAFADANPDALVVLGGDLNDTPGSDPLNALEEDGGLFRVTSVLGDNAGTIRFAGTSQAIDHLYLATNASGVLVEESVAVVRDASGTLGGSDHAAVRATFVLP